MIRVVLAFVLVSSLMPGIPAAAWADGTPEGSASREALAGAGNLTRSGNPADSNAATPGAIQPSADSPWDAFYAGTLETSVERDEAIAPFALDSAGVTALKSGTHVRWIDRIDVPAYVTQFYAVLEEAADNDGYRDFLIDGRYKNGTAAPEGAYIRVQGRGALLLGTVARSASTSLDALRNEMGEYGMAAMAAFDRDHPEVFWLSGAVAFGFLVRESQVSCYLVLNDSRWSVISDAYATTYQVRRGLWERDRALRSILQGLKPGATQEEAVRYFSRWLVDHNEYNADIAAAQDRGPWECLSALRGQSGANGPVCEGYSRAFKALCDRAAIPCVLVDGNADEPHMWNNVQLAGAWYGVDVTWNDTAPGWEEDFLLVGEATQYGTGEEAVTFGELHRMQNMSYEGSVAFTNGPRLSPNEFVRGTVTPAARITLPVVGAEPTMALTSMALSKSAYTFDGKTHRPGVTIYGEGGQLVKNRDYRVTYSGSQKSVGTYRVTVTGIGRYGGSLSKTYRINAPAVKKVAKPTVKSPTRRTLAVTWKRVGGNVSGYQVQACPSKKFKKAVTKKTVKLTKKTKKAKTLKLTLKKLKAKRTYYVRARAYYKVAGKTFYGTWSPIRKVRVK